jgi:hypothetical protein
MTTIIDGSAGITFPNGSGPQFASAKVIQVGSSTSTTSFTTTTNGWVDIPNLSVTITPQSTTSKILVLANVAMGADSDFVLRLVRNSTAIGTGTVGANANGFVQMNGTAPVQYSMLSGGTNFLDSPSTTSATTYKVQGWVNSGHTGYINIRQYDSTYGGGSTITVMEIAYA